MRTEDCYGNSQLTSSMRVPKNYLELKRDLERSKRRQLVLPGLRHKKRTITFTSSNLENELKNVNIVKVAKNVGRAKSQVRSYSIEELANRNRSRSEQYYGDEEKQQQAIREMLRRRK